MGMSTLPTAILALYPATRITPASVLLCAGRPPAVAGFIVPIRIDPVNTVIQPGPRAHIGKEALEVTPRLADRDPALAVAGIRGITRVRASSVHRGPRFVRRGLGPAVFVTRRSLTDICGELGTGRFGVRTAKAAATWLELARVTRGVFGAATAGRALHRCAMLWSERLTFARSADPLSTLLSHVVASARTSWRASFSNLSVTLAGATGRASGHTESIGHRLDQHYGRVAA